MENVHEIIYPLKKKLFIRKEMISFELQRFNKKGVNEENKLEEFIIFNF